MKKNNLTQENNVNNTGITSFENTIKRINFLLAMAFAVFPFLLFFLGIITEIYFDSIFNIWVLVCFFIFIVGIKVNFETIKKAFNHKKVFRFLIILSFICIGLLVISNIITNSLNGYSFQIIGYFLLFYLVVIMEEKYRYIFFQTLLASIAFSAICSLIDPRGHFLPGVCSIVQMASFFGQANYSANIIGITLVLVVNMILKEQNKKVRVIYYAYFVVFALFMFVNASFVGITAVFCILFLELIILWIKNKKFPYQILLFIVCFALFAGIIEIIPNIHEITTCKYNYFIEVIAVFDNIFKTNLLGATTSIEYVQGADGWSRGELLSNSLKALFGTNDMNFLERAKNFLFGFGGGSINNYRPHNLFVGLWVDFGFLFALCYVALIILLVVYMALSLNQNKSDVRPYFYSSLAYLLITLFGSLLVFHHVYFVILLALGICLSKNNINILKDIKKKEINSKKFISK